jgi:hypothetical protein
MVPATPGTRTWVSAHWPCCIYTEISRFISGSYKQGSGLPSVGTDTASLAGR